MVLASPLSLHLSASSMAWAMACAGSGAGKMPSALGEAQRGVEDGALLDARMASISPASLSALTLGAHAVVAQTTAVDRRGHEVVSQRVHLEHAASRLRCRQSHRHTDALGQTRRGRRFHGNDAAAACRRSRSRAQRGRQSRRSWSRRPYTRSRCRANPHRPPPTA
jgi:hypothetical protein